MRRRLLVAALRGAVVGLVVTGTAVAAIGLAPVEVPTDPLAAPGLPGVTADDVAPATPAEATSSNALTPGRTELAPADIPAAAAAAVAPLDGGRLPAGAFLVGASRASLAPAPEVFGTEGDTWQTEGCTIYDQGQIDVDHAVPSSPEEIKGWPAASPDCIYLGGFGIGPVRPAERLGQGGVWVRALAVSNGETTVAYAIADTVGWFARYDSTVCADCGILDVRETLAGDLGVDVGNIVVGSTHTHAGADTYGGWGGIPDWYRAQLRDAATAAIKQAVANARPASLTVGEADLRQRNGERRDTYWSNADTGATWLQARALPAEGCKPKKEDCSPVIATMGAFAAHPTIVGDPILHADWPGATARRFEATYGGVGLLFEGGLGNVSVKGVGGDGDEAQAESTGIAIADDIAADIAHSPTLLRSNDIAAAAEVVAHPVTTNPGIAALGAVGIFDREFTPGTKGSGPPSTYRWSKGDGPGAARSCVSAGPTVITTAGAHRIGELLVGFAPGEAFGGITEVVKEERNQQGVTMVLGQSNDALGYLIPSIEFDDQANLVTEYGTQTGEYEEVFALDRCIGDHVLDALLRTSASVGG